MGRKRSTFLEDSNVYSVSELTRLIQRQIEGEFGSIQVEGEISGFKVSHSGHAYFSLKEATALLNCVMWRSTVARLAELPQDGQRVLASGGLSVYPPRGAYQLIVKSIQLAGEGLLMKRFLELKARLEAEGLFDAGRKKGLPAVPARVAVVTSPTGAAIRDFLATSCPELTGLEVDIFPVHVQGATAAAEIAHALEVLGRLPGYDAIVLTRGGGSLEDLWSFNEEVVARAIADSSVAVISAVGHEVDFTISDFVADVRMPTPTAAGQHLAELRESKRVALLECVERIGQRIERNLDGLRHQMERAHDSLLRFSPLHRIDTERQRLDDSLVRLRMQTLSHREHRKIHLEKAAQNLLRQAPALLRQKRQSLESLRAHFSALSPSATLERGYSLTARAQDGQILKSAQGLAEGELVITQLHRGRFESKITKVENG